MTTHRSLDQSLTDTAEAQADAMPRWRRSLTEVFAVDRGSYTTADRHSALSLPDRRGFFQLGGTSIAGAALLVACGGDDDTAGPDVDAADPTAVPAEGTEEPTAAPDDGGGGNEMDLVLLRTATSLELAAVAAYQAAVDTASALGITAPVAEAATLFQSHHAEHAAALQGATEQAGGTPYEEPNPFFMRTS